MPMDSHGFPWVPIGIHGFPWVAMGSHGNPWVPMGSMGPHGVPMGSPWGPMGSPWLPWKIQECRKSSILMKTTIRFDRKLETRGPDRCAIFFRSILSRQNPLNRHMEQNIFFCPKIQFFSFSAYRAPIEPLYEFPSLPKGGGRERGGEGGMGFVT